VRAEHWEDPCFVATYMNVAFEAKEDRRAHEGFEWLWHLRGTGQAAPGALQTEIRDYVRRMIPKRMAGTYQFGVLSELRVQERAAYLLKPSQHVDPERRWVWICPFWLAIDDEHGRLHHRFYVEKLLAAGFHVAGIDVGTSCGSPAAVEVCHAFFKRLVNEHGLSSRARLVGQSNGGLIAYAWAFRHPDVVDRIGGIGCVSDFRTWPGLENVVLLPDKGLDYGLTLDQLTHRAAEFNPIDNLAPLAERGVKILHVHGEKDELVLTAPNSLELGRRYQELGGPAQIILVTGLGHGGMPLYASQPLIEFLLAE
jgi:pimeloyl-ACP methyl ester carboxylesterase